MNLNMFGKAGLGILIAFVGAMVTVLGPGNESVGDITTRGWLQIVIAVLGSGALIAVVDNIVGVAGGVAKAILAFLSTGVPAVFAAMDDNVLTQAELLSAFSVAVIATGFVYQTPAITRAVKRSL